MADLPDDDARPDVFCDLSPSAVSDLVFKIANGEGKGRADGRSPAIKHWQTFLTVNGETTLGDLLKSDGRSA